MGLALAIVLILVLGHWARKRKEMTGREFALGRVGLAPAYWFADRRLVAKRRVIDARHAGNEGL